MCVVEYARKNAALSASATDIAEAAISHCQSDLGFYKFYRQGYHRAMGISNDLIGLYRSREKEEEKSQLDTMELIEEGKRLVIKTLIEIRQ
ncbi:hypothetical protein KA005_77380 [bacterium]|nr:hypothetical protein [bacterium]